MFRRPFLFPEVACTHEGFEVRTGQVHRTLAGHTAPVSCLQFDELHIMSGSLDKTIRVRASPSPSLLPELYLNLTCLCLPSLPLPLPALPFFRLSVLQQIWDIRTGMPETIKFDHAVTALQFDSRKVLAAAGENSVKVLYFPHSFPFYCFSVSYDLFLPASFSSYY